MATPGLPELLDRSARTSTAKQRGPVPARVVSYDRATQTCEALPLVTPRGVELPSVPSVPVAFPRAAGIAVTWDLAPDDPVLLIPCECDVSRWHARGIAGEAPTTRTRSLADSIAIPCGVPLGDATGEVDAGALILSCADLRLGDAAASDFVALASLVLSELQAIKSYLDTHTHTAGAYVVAGVQAGAGTLPVTFASGSPSSPMPAPGSVAATKVKAT